MCINGRAIIDFDHSPGGWVATHIGDMKQVAAHNHLFFEGDARNSLYIVESGWAKLYRTLVDGQRQVVGFCGAGSVMGLEGAAEHANGCEAVTALKVRTIPVKRLAEVCARDPHLAVQLIGQVGNQLGAAQAQLTSVGAQSADQKLATFLLAVADVSQGRDAEFDLPMRRSEMAEFLGLRLETVSRKMSDFQRRKWIKMISMYHLRLLNRSALECLAEGGDVEEAGYAMLAA